MNTNTNTNTVANTINLNETAAHRAIQIAIEAVLATGDAATVAATLNRLDAALECNANGGVIVFAHVHHTLSIEGAQASLKGLTTPAAIAAYLNRHILNF